MAVVQYAIETLAVRHVIVCGHYGCGGVRAALDNNFDGQAHVERWLSPLRQLVSTHRKELDGCASDDDRWAKLCEMNVVEQTRRLIASDVLVRAGLAGMDVSVHGLIYSLHDGLLHPLVPPVR
jgi:carbonic anhydrase